MVVSRCSPRIGAEPYQTVATTDSYELRFLIDLDGDHIDEAIYDSRHYEGRYVTLLGWSRDGGAIRRTLTGDGT